MRVYALSAEQTAELYSFLLQYIVAAAKRSRGELDPYQVFQEGINGDAVFWIVVDGNTPKGLIATKIEPSGEFMRIVLASGRDMRRWLENAKQTIQEHAIANGCKGFIWEGRDGWGRVLGVRPARHSENGLAVYEVEIA